MKIAIIGAGYGGMSAAHDFRKAGHDVTIFEAANYAGGLAAGFKDLGWKSSLENFYHHWFASDSEMLGLLTELGLRDQVVFKVPKTVVYHKGDFFPLDSPLAALTFPGFTFFDMVRFGFVTVYLRYLASWKPLEKFTAHEWMNRYYGESIYKAHFEPMLVGKFGAHYKEVTMAWFWARFKARSTSLGTFKGGFQTFSDAFADILRKAGVQIRLSTAVTKIDPAADGGLTITTPSGNEHFDRCLATVSPALFSRMAPALPPAYLQGLLNLKSMGAVVMVVALKHKLSPKGYYWYNIPKSAGFPFLALVEHTNFVPAEEYNGDTLIYCGDYLDVDHEYFNLSKEELLERFLPSFKRINPDFDPSWVRTSWLFRTHYAQPIPLVNHSQNIPDVKTPIPGLYFASMSQVYPWDRGTNFAVQIARCTASQMLTEM